MKEKAGATFLHVKSARQKKGSGSRRVTWASRRRPSPPLRKLGQPAELKEVEDQLSGARLSLCVPPHRRRGAHALRCVHCHGKHPGQRSGFNAHAARVLGPSHLPVPQESPTS